MIFLQAESSELFVLWSGSPRLQAELEGVAKLERGA